MDRIVRIKIFAYTADFRSSALTGQANPRDKFLSECSLWKLMEIMK